MEVVIEQAAKEDIFKLIEVQNLSFYDDFIKFGECPSYNENVETVMSLINSELVYKIIVDKQIVGDIVIRKKSESYYYIRTLSVIPRYQNFGIGKYVLKFIEQDNPNVKLWRLITPKQNKRNCNFYEKMGYSNVGEILHSYSLTLVKYEKCIND